MHTPTSDQVLTVIEIKEVPHLNGGTSLWKVIFSNGYTVLQTSLEDIFRKFI